MRDDGHQRHELAFLIDQCAQVNLKIARAQNALQTTHSSLEDSSLHDMLCAAETERALLDGLMNHNCGVEGSLSLEALIMHQLAEARQAHESMIGIWRRGNPAPADYWETETRYLLLSGLLQHYQNWMRAFPDSGPVFAQARVESRAADEGAPEPSGHLRPWQPVGTSTGGEIVEPARFIGTTHSPNPLIALEDAIYAALDHAGIPQGYLEVVVESPDMVMARGYARSHDERTTMLTAIMSVGEVREVLSDIAVLSHGQQPPALYDRAHRMSARRVSEQPGA